MPYPYVLPYAPEKQVRPCGVYTLGFSMVSIVVIYPPLNTREFQKAVNFWNKFRERITPRLRMPQRERDWFTVCVVRLPHR